MLINHPGFLRKSNNVIFLIFILLLCISCGSINTNEAPVLSDEAKKALDRVDFMAGHGHGKEALVYLDSAFSTFTPSTKDNFERLRLKTQYTFVQQGDLMKANSYVDSMLILIGESKEIYKTEYLDALFFKGAIKLKGDEKKEAFKYYYDAKEFARTNLDSCNAYWYTYRIGLVRYNQKQYAEAIRDIRQAFAKGSHCYDQDSKDPVYMNRQSMFNTIGICFEKLEELDSAVLYYNAGLTYIDKVAPNFPEKKVYLQSAKGVIYGNMGGVYLRMQKYKEAENCLKKSIEINDRPLFEQVDAQTAKLKLLELYLETSNYKKANLLLAELWQVVTNPLPERKMPDGSRIKLNRLQWKYFDKTGNQNKAYEWLQRYYRLGDSISNNEQKQKVLNINSAFRMQDQEERLFQLNKEKEIERIYSIAFAVFLVMASIILFITWRNWSNLKVLNAKITDQNLDMQKALEALQESQEENTRLVKMVAHDLRNPMAITISIVDIVLRSDGVADTNKDLLNMVKTSNENSLEMIADLLNMSTRKEEMKKESVEIHTMLNYCVELLKFRAAEKKQTITLHAPWLTLFINREKIWRVIGNLITNAIKFSPEGKNIEVEVLANDQTVLISVRDEGIGIPAELGVNIFNLFTESKRLGTFGETSYGLGLAIAKQIVEAHDGKIWFESELGKGSTFYVELPIHVEHLDLGEQINSGDAMVG